MENKTIIIYAPSFIKNCIAILILYYLGYLIDKNFENINVYIYDFTNKLIKNNILNKYINKKRIPNENIVIYPEIISGNPLKSKKCVRYILCELGKHSKSDIYKSWGRQDLVFHHSSFNGKKNNKVNLFSIIYRNPIFKDLGEKRENNCFTIRKANKFYKKIEYIHPKNSIEIINQSHEELLKIFNKCKYFYCYDPYTGLSNIALLCGCIPIIPKLANISEEEYLKSKSSFQYENIKKIPGYSYGIENLEYAEKTIKEGKELILNQDKRNCENLLNFIKNILNPNYKENVLKYFINNSN